MKIIRIILIILIVLQLNYIVYDRIFINYGGKLVVHNGYLPRDINPLWHIRIEEFEIDKLIYNSLCDLDRDGNPNFSLLEDAYLEGNVWYFKIKKDIFFSSSKATLTSYDVKDSLEYLKNSSNPYNFIYKNIRDIKVIDSLNFLIEINQPDSLFLLKLCHPAASIFRKWKKANGGFNFLGTGPFKIINKDLPYSLNLIANENYYNGMPFIDNVTFYSSLKMNPLFYFKMGSVDVISLYQNKIISTEDLSNYPILRIEKPILSFLLLNPKRIPTSNTDFRNWLYSQIDKKGFLNSLFNGKGNIVDALFTDYQSNNNNNGTIPKFYETLIIVVLDNDFISKSIAERLQALLIAKGIRNQIIYSDNKAFLDKQRQGDFHIIVSYAAPFYKEQELNILYFASLYSYFRDIENIDIINYPKDFEISLLRKKILIPIISIYREYLAQKNIHFYRKDFQNLSDFEYAWIIENHFAD